MSRITLADDLRNAIAPHIKRFVGGKSEAAVAAETEIKRLEDFRKTLGDNSPALKGIDRAIQDLAYDPTDDAKQRKRDAAFALVTVCNDLGLPVLLKPGKGKGANSAGTSPTTRAKVPAAVLNAGQAAVLKSLKSGGSGKAELLIATGLDDKAYGSVKRALLKAGKVKTVGAGRAAKLTLA